MTKRYTLDGEPVEVEDFIADNRGHTVSNPFTDEDVAAIRALEPGQEIVYGGGAFAEFVLRCESKVTLKDIADEAQEAFWAKVVELLPECKTGDFPPEATFALNQACREAVETWYGFNKPV